MSDMNSGTEVWGSSATSLDSKVRNPALGYCQGMNSVAAMLLSWLGCRDSSAGVI